MGLISNLNPDPISLIPEPVQQAALEDLCLGVPRGERFGFLGPNGAGKTTTLSILAGRQHATAGAALVAGVPAGSPEARRHLGYCPQVRRRVRSG